MASGGLQTVERALDILLSFNSGRKEWGVTELAREFDLHPSTSQRVLATMASKGFLIADPDSRKYRLGPAALQLARAWEHTGRMASISTHVLASLARHSGRTAILTIPDGFHMRCIAEQDGQFGPIRPHSLVGELYPAHAGATSRAYFSFLPKAERTRLLSGQTLGKFSDLTELDLTRIEESWDATAATGWAISEGEFDKLTRALAVPIMVDGTPIASMTLLEFKNVTYPSTLESLLPLLTEAANDLSSILSISRRRTSP